MENFIYAFTNVNVYVWTGAFDIKLHAFTNVYVWTGAFYIKLHAFTNVYVWTGAS